MKKLIILILALALVAAAFFTRPSQADFKQFVVDRKTSGDANAFKRGFDELRAEQFVNGCQFKDRFLWVDVQKDGKTIYTGAFSHWFNHGKIETEMDKAKGELDKAKQEMNSIHIEKK